MRKALSAIAVPVVIVAGLLVGYALFHPPDYQGPHVVDGVHMGAEGVCPAAPSPDDILCALAVPFATQVLVSREPAAVVVRASIAEPTCSSGGKTFMCTFAGLAQPAFVVFDLKDGSRRVIGVNCQGPVYNNSNAIVEAPKCMPGDLDSWRTH